MAHCNQQTSSETPIFSEERRIHAKRSKVINCVNELSAVYDNESQVFGRANKHKSDDSEEDELILLRELRKIKPFDFKESRSYEGFKTIQPSLMCQLDACEFAKWFEEKKLSFTA